MLYKYLSNWGNEEEGLSCLKCLPFQACHIMVFKSHSLGGKEEIMINHAHFCATLNPFSRFERGRKRNQHPRVTGDLERVLGDNYSFYSNVGSTAQL